MRLVNCREISEPMCAFCQHRRLLLYTVELSTVCCASRQFHSSSLLVPLFFWSPHWNCTSVMTFIAVELLSNNHKMASFRSSSWINWRGLLWSASPSKNRHGGRLSSVCPVWTRSASPSTTTYNHNQATFFYFHLACLGLHNVLNISTLAIAFATLQC